MAFAVALGAGALSLAACSGATAEQSPQTSAAVSRAPVGQNTHGVVKVVGDALGEVPLRAEQRAELEKLAQAAEQRHAATAEGRKELALAIADQVEKGNLDRAALEPKIDRVVSDFEKLRPEDKAALARVHAILDKEQRNAFVDALESGFKGKHHAHKAGFMKMKALADELKLTDDQRAKIFEVMKESRAQHAAGGEIKGEHRFRHHKGMHAMHGKKAIESFREDQFDADALMPAASREKIAAGQTHFLGAAEKILPLLTPEQRKIAADKIRSMAEKGDLGLPGH
jgi:Spy/CpxP family protein refolding chaperone